MIFVEPFFLMKMIISNASVHLCSIPGTVSKVGTGTKNDESKLRYFPWSILAIGTGASGSPNLSTGSKSCSNIGQELGAGSWVSPSMACGHEEPKLSREAESDRSSHRCFLGESVGDDKKARKPPLKTNDGKTVPLFVKTIWYLHLTISKWFVHILRVPPKEGTFSPLRRRYKFMNGKMLGNLAALFATFLLRITFSRFNGDLSVRKPLSFGLNLLTKKGRLPCSSFLFASFPRPAKNREYEFTREWIFKWISGQFAPLPKMNRCLHLSEKTTDT